MREEDVGFKFNFGFSIKILEPESISCSKLVLCSRG